jgi:hypothetical protein
MNYLYLAKSRVPLSLSTTEQGLPWDPKNAFYFTGRGTHHVNTLRNTLRKYGIISFSWKTFDGPTLVLFVSQTPEYSELATYVDQLRGWSVTPYEDYGRKKIRMTLLAGGLLILSSCLLSAAAKGGQ